MRLDSTRASRSWLPDWIDRPWAGSVLLVALAVAAMAVDALITRQGVSLGSDSAAYLAAARNLLGGFGLSWLSGGEVIRPLVLHAPLYPLVLAMFGALNVDLLLVARWLNILALGATVMAFGTILRHATGSRWVGLWGALLFASTGELLQIHAWAMSDPLFLATTMVSLVLAGDFLVRRKTSVFVGAALAASAAYLTRYAGLALVGGLAIVLLLAPAVPRARRLRQAAFFFAVGALPIAFWFIRNLRLTGQMAGRTFGKSGADFLAGIERTAFIVFNWVLPLRVVEWMQNHFPLLALLALVAGIALVLAFVGSLRAWSSEGPRWRTAMTALLASYSVAYLSLLAISYLFSRPGTDLDDRTLMPLYPVLLAFLGAAGAWLWSRRSRGLQVVVALAFMVLLRNKLAYSALVVNGLMNQAQGYASEAWRVSPTIHSLRELSPEVVYTNDIAAVYLLATPHVYLVPLRAELATGEERADFLEDLADMRRRIDRGDAVLVLFGQEDWPAELAPLDELLDGLVPVAVERDGVIYAGGGTELGKVGGVSRKCWAPAASADDDRPGSGTDLQGCLDGRGSRPNESRAAISGNRVNGRWGGTW